VREKLGEASAEAFYPVWFTTGVTGKIKGELWAAARLGPLTIHDLELSGVFSTNPVLPLKAEISGESAHAGNVRRHEVFYYLQDLIEIHEVQTVVDALPETWRGEFAAWLRAEYDNEIPVDQMVWIDSGRGEHPGKDMIVGRIRRWIGLPRS
jgi:hypothetical protein